ncbi:MAG: transposase [Casimicrobiaceae bacterium]|nr:transposase [Casimicrobiaceae bacterium]
MFERRERSEEQAELWVVAGELPAATPDTFYRRVNATLEKIGFAKEVWAICEPAYAEVSKGGRPGIDPVVYLKMLTVGFFENLPSERAIASRCADSLSIRGYLGYQLTEATPDHSSLSVIRQRLWLEQLEAIHRVLLRALREHGLLRGRKLGIDSSVIEANASLRALEDRNSEESYWDYVKRLAAQAGIDPADIKAVRRFDRQREGRKTSNQQWQNPHDAEAKVGRTKDGACDMIHKPEHISDLESGAIISAEVRSGDAADNDESLCERVMAAVGTLSEVVPETPIEALGRELCADEGYFAVEPIAQLQACGVRTVIADPQARRRSLSRASDEQRSALRRASRAVRSKSGKALLRSRGEHLERGFCHVLDHGGQRRATLRGCEKLTKRHLCGAMSYNLSLLMRPLIGVGTPKQALAGARKALRLLIAWLRRALLILASVSDGPARTRRQRFPTALTSIRLAAK